MRSVLAVCAHPDDESFGLGAALHGFARQGAAVHVLCFTHGEASTLGAVSAAELHALRAQELAAAARELGLTQTTLLAFPDGGLSAVPVDDLAGEVERKAVECGAEVLLVFDEGGVTGHPDHERATEAALAAGGALPVLAWAVPEVVAGALNAELDTAFVGRAPGELDLVVAVDRRRQERAIDCHASQSAHNPVLRRRLELSGDREAFRWLRRPLPEVVRAPPD